MWQLKIYFIDFNIKFTYNIYVSQKKRTGNKVGKENQQGGKETLGQS